MVCFIVINSFFVSFEIGGGPYNPSQNTLRLINLSFKGSLIVDFVELFNAMAKILFIEGRLGTRLCVHSTS